MSLGSVNAQNANRPRGLAIVNSTFMGSRNQMWAIGAATGVRNALEDFHGRSGTVPDQAVGNAGSIQHDEEAIEHEVRPTSRVIFPGGACAYGQAARLMPGWIQDFTARMRIRMAADIARFRLGDGPNRESDTYHLRLCLGFATGWDLPEVSEKDIAVQHRRIEAAVLRRSGSVRQPDDRIRRAIAREAFIEAFLMPFGEGDPRPASAAAAGLPVVVQVGNKWDKWENISHFSDADMEAFNRGLSNHLYALLIAVDRARGHDDHELPHPIPIGLPMNWPFAAAC